jgi:tetratricopeptide (TPR) repeat protein
LTLAPTTSIVPIASEVGAERRMYLPMVGLVALVVIGLSRLLDRQRIAGGAVAAVVVVGTLGWVTVQRTTEYATPLGMAQTVLERWPSPSAHYMVGTELVTAGRATEAVPHLRQAAAAIPPARFNLGSALFTTGQRAEGIAELEAFLRAEPNLVTARDARLLLSRGYAEAGRIEDSLSMARQVLTAAPADHAAHALMAEAYSAQARFGEAIPHFEAYLRVQRDDGAGWTGLGIALMSSGRGADGVNAFRQAVAVAQQNAGYRMNLARALIDTGQPAAAIEHARAAVQLTGGDPAAVELLARAEQR